MFAPRPPETDGWFVCRGVLADGSERDLLRDGRPVEWGKPARVSPLYPNERWRKFLMNLPTDGQDENRAHLLRYLWENWNATHPPEQQLLRLELHFILVRTRAAGGTEAPKPLFLAATPAGETISPPARPVTAGVPGVVRMGGEGGSVSP
jgi:hypothetical protein